MAFDFGWGIATPGALAIINTMTEALTILPADLVFPVGSIYTSVSSTNPGTSLGYGTWVAFGTGRTIIGLDSTDTDFDTVEELGGAKEVSAVVANHSAHTHSVTSNVAVGDHSSHTHAVDVGNTTSGAPSATTTFKEGAGADITVASSSHTHDTDPASVTSGNESATLDHSVTNNAVTSGNESATLTHSITASSVVQPYIVVYMWKRTA